jgi:hypothetical protein
MDEGTAKPTSSTSPPLEKRRKLEEQQQWVNKLEFCMKKVTHDNLLILLNYLN